MGGAKVIVFKSGVILSAKVPALSFVRTVREGHYPYYVATLETIPETAQGQPSETAEPSSASPVQSE